MKPSKQTDSNDKTKTIKVFKPLDTNSLEKVIGGPIGTRGTETIVQAG